MDDMEIDWEGMYKSSMDSVNLLAAGQFEWQLDEEWEGIVERNVEHLKIVVVKDWPEGFDLAPFNAAIENA